MITLTVVRGDAPDFPFIFKDSACCFQECQTFRVEHSVKVLQDFQMDTDVSQMDTDVREAS